MDRGLHTFGLRWVIGRGGRSRGKRLDSVSGRLGSGAVVDLTASARRSTAADGRTETAASRRPMTGGLTKLPVVRESWHRQANGCFRVQGPVQHRLPGKIPSRSSWAGSANSARVHRQLLRRSVRSQLWAAHAGAVRDAPTCPELPRVARHRASAPVSLRNSTDFSPTACGQERPAGIRCPVSGRKGSRGSSL